MNKEEIIDNHDLTFDPGDKLNGSLYLGSPLESKPALNVEQTIAQLQAIGLWSSADPKRVGDEQRQAYKDQLDLAEVTQYKNDSGSFLIARFDHPKFPSSAERFAAWQDFFDQSYNRLS